MVDLSHSYEFLFKDFKKNEIPVSTRLPPLVFKNGAVGIDESRVSKDRRKFNKFNFNSSKIAVESVDPLVLSTGSQKWSPDKSLSPKENYDLIKKWMNISFRRDKSAAKDQRGYFSLFPQAEAGSWDYTWKDALIDFLTVLVALGSGVAALYAGSTGGAAILLFLAIYALAGGKSPADAADLLSSKIECQGDKKIQFTSKDGIVIGKIDWTKSGSILITNSKKKQVHMPVPEGMDQKCGKGLLSKVKQIGESARSGEISILPEGEMPSKERAISTPAVAR